MILYGVVGKLDIHEWQTWRGRNGMMSSTGGPLGEVGVDWLALRVLVFGVGAPLTSSRVTERLVM